MVTRTELTLRVEELEKQVIAQTDLTDRVDALVLLVATNKDSIQKMTVADTLLCNAVVDLQKKVSALNSPKPVEKKIKSNTRR